MQKKGWESFSDTVLNVVLNRANDTGRGMVFFTWGILVQKMHERLQIDEVYPFTSVCRGGGMVPDASAKCPFCVTVCGDFLYFSGLFCLFQSRIQ